MVKSFGVEQNNVGKWAGLCSAMFSICQAIMGIPWGRFSDQYGRKPAILLGLSSTMLTSLLWGFSTNLPMAIIARGLAGAGNGNVGIIRTTVAEMVPFKELQPRAFSIMPLVWNIGSIFGPTIGGALANPFNVKPGEDIRHPSLLQRFPYALPNLVAAVFFTIGIITGILFLEETLETLATKRDPGLVLGKKLSSFVKSHFLLAEEMLHIRKAASKDDQNEHEPLLKSQQDEETLLLQPKEPPPPPPSYREVLNKSAIMNLIVYTLLALHTMAFDALLPVYMQFPPLKAHTDSSTTTTLEGNPLKFAGGFGLDHFRIGLITTAYGVCGMVVQFFLFPPIARRFGILNCMKACAVTFPIVYFLTPFTALLPTLKSQVGCMFAVMLLKCFAGIFAFPCSTILLTNSASSLRTLGTLNGFATSFSAVGRAIGPAVGGAMFTFGVDRGYVIVPWWLFCVIGIIAAVPVFWLVEGEGFGGDDGDVSDEEDFDEQDEEVLREEALEGGAEAAGKPGPYLIPTEQQVQEEAESQDVMGPLTRTTTMSSALSLGSDEYISPTVSRQASWAGRQDSIPGRPEGQPSLSRRNSRRIVRRTSIPIGMGGQGISRRYSSNLGQSLGSAGGSYHGH